MEIGLPGIVVTADMLYRDVVLDDCYLTPNAMVEQHLEYLLKSNSGGLPVHKYVSRYDGQVYTPRLLKCIEEHSTIQSFRNNALKEASKSYHAKCNDLSVNAVIDAEGRDNAFKKLVMLDEHEIDVNDLESYLVDLMSDNPGITKGNPELRRLIRIYDLLRYKITPDKSPNSGRTVTT